MYLHWFFYVQKVKKKKLLQKVQSTLNFHVQKVKSTLQFYVQKVSTPNLLVQKVKSRYTKFRVWNVKSTLNFYDQKVKSTLNWHVQKVKSNYT